MRRPGDVLRRSEILDHVWDYAYDGTSNVVDVYVRYLRNRLGEAGADDLIETVRGVGYRLAALDVRIVPASLRHRLVAGRCRCRAHLRRRVRAFAAWRIQRAEDQAVRAALLSRVELARDEVAPDGSLPQDAGSPKTDLVQVIGPDGAVRSSSPALPIGPLVTLVDVRQLPRRLPRQRHPAAAPTSTWPCWQSRSS